MRFTQIGRHALVSMVSCLAACFCYLSTSTVTFAQQTSCSDRYTVRVNETWATIASRCNVTRNELVEINPGLYQLRNNRLPPGDVLVIPQFQMEKDGSRRPLPTTMAVRLRNLLRQEWGLPLLPASQDTLDINVVSFTYHDEPYHAIAYSTGILQPGQSTLPNHFVALWIHTFTDHFELARFDLPETQAFLSHVKVEQVDAKHIWLALTGVAEMQNVYQLLSFDGSQFEVLRTGNNHADPHESFLPGIVPIGPAKYGFFLNQETGGMGFASQRITLYGDLGQGLQELLTTTAIGITQFGAPGVIQSADAYLIPYENRSEINFVPGKSAAFYDLVIKTEGTHLVGDGTTANPYAAKPFSETKTYVLTQGFYQLAKSSSQATVSPTWSGKCSLQSHLQIGAWAIVSRQQDAPNTLWTGAGNGVAVKDHADKPIRISPGGRLNISGGPHCVNNILFWQVTTDSITGWTGEGREDDYWLVPAIND